MNQKERIGEPDEVVKWHKKPDRKGGYESNTTNVGLYQPNAWGLYDMYGTVSEWCVSRKYDSWGKDPLGKVYGEKNMRSRCGGGWAAKPFEYSSYANYFESPDKPTGGFRLCCTLSK